MSISRVKKRPFERVHVNIETAFICDNKLFTGKIVSISENGLAINMERLPSKTSFDLTVCFQERDIIIPVKFKRLGEEYGYFYTLLVEVVDPPVEYFELLESLRFSPDQADFYSPG
jgi:hypothetical protein